MNCKKGEVLQKMQESCEQVVEKGRKARESIKNYIQEEIDKAEERKPQSVKLQSLRMKYVRLEKSLQS